MVIISAPSLEAAQQQAQHIANDTGHSYTLWRHGTSNVFELHRHNPKVPAHRGMPRGAVYLSRVQPTAPTAPLED